jgi:hypothetical protein
MGYTHEIWTLEKTEEFCDKVLKYVQDNHNCYTLGRATIECDEYEEVISYLENKFKTEFKSIKKAKTILKQRCIELGMDGKTNPTMTIFNLVNNFDMVNTNTKSDITTKGKSINSIDLTKLSKETLDELERNADNED